MKISNIYTAKSNWLLAVILTAIVVNTSTAREIMGTPPSHIDNNLFRTMADGCKAPTAQVDLDINNVRTTILNGGDMWWNLISAKYEIPKVTDPNGIRKHSIFAGSLWIGGVDAGNNLKLAAMTYRQNGIDFFAGAIDSVDALTSTAKIAPERCEYYDKIYKVTREEIDLYLKNFSANTTKAILDWPGNGNIGYGEEFHMAPYIENGGGFGYQPGQGDYPDVKGDQALWFVYNDIGNIHSETQGVPIGLELKTTAFAFTTNDEINNMTFYSTEITNYGEPVKDCYFGQWIDPDLGNYSDDYVGCDTNRNLGYCYNGDDNDEGILGYGLNPPTVGLDLFRGPKNENGDELPLYAFMYYNNDFSVIGNPTKPLHYYNYLRALWQDGQHVTYGGNGRGGATPYNFMFNGDPVTNNGWTEKGAGNQPGDRRFLQSVGPLTLKTGARNEMTVGAVWARSSIGGATGSLTQLKNADDKAQILFNNNFKLIDGPRAPDLSIKEYDNELIVVLENTNTVETESYVGKIRNPFSKNPLDSFIYKYQGYQIYQLKDASVTTGDLDNTEKARIINQMDINDNVTQLINRVYDPVVGSPLLVSKVIGNNAGVVHSFSVKEDLFATGDKRLVNFKQYHFMVIAYANLTNDPMNQNPEQYLAGRLNVKRYTGIPHKPDPTSSGSKINALYGSGPMITRMQGQGNGGNSLELTKASIDQILRDGKMDFPVYTNGFGPIRVSVIDPLKVPKAEFEFNMKDTSKYSKSPNVMRDSAIWTLTNKTTGKVTNCLSTLKKFNEQIIKEYGFSIAMKQPNQPGIDSIDKNYGSIESSVEFSDPTRKWLSGVKDQDGGGYYNWIRAGVNGKAESFGYDAQGGLNDKSKYTYDFARFGSPLEGLDPFENYEKVCDGRMAPYKLCSRAARSTSTGEDTYGPAFEGSSVSSNTENSMANLISIDLVLTPDKSKWTKCVVVEMSEDPLLAEGNRKKWSIRDHASWTGNIIKDPSTGNYIPEYDPTDRGRSWFPGYAINIETGERLNIIMGENSWLKGYNGADMVWNPTADVANFNGPLWGGMHHVYVCAPVKYGSYTGPIYDEGLSYQAILSTPNKIDDANTKRQVASQVQWVTMPYMVSGYNINYDGGKLNIPSEMRYRVRVSKPYSKYVTSSKVNPDDYPYYTFNTNDIAVDHSTDLGKAAMDKINVVPNPYYGASNYENSQLDTRVKFINLPPKCVISIYSLSGTLVRQIKKDDDLTYADWDMKNQAQVPIASGLYIVHVNAFELGEKIVKWYGIMRPVDLDTF